MSSLIQSTDPANIIASKQAGHTVLRVEIPKDIEKVKTFQANSKFLVVKMSANDKAFALIIDGVAPSSVAIPILFGAPTREEAKGGANSKRVSICLAMSQSGDLGRAIDILDTEFHEQITANLGKVWVGTLPPKIQSPVKKTFGDGTKKISETGGSMRGQRRDDPLISLSIDFTPYPVKAPKQFAGKPHTTIYDWSTRTIDPSGRELFKECLGSDGHPLCLENAASIIKSGDIIRRILIANDGISITTTGINLRLRVYKMWIEPSPNADLDYIPIPGTTQPTIATPLPEPPAPAATAASAATTTTTPPAAVAPATAVPAESTAPAVEPTATPAAAQIAALSQPAKSAKPAVRGKGRAAPAAVPAAAAAPAPAVKGSKKAAPPPVEVAADPEEQSADAEDDATYEPAESASMS